MAIVVLAVGLSLLPIPDALRPFPKLTEQPLQTVARAVWPQRAGAVAQPPPPELEKIVVADEPEEEQGEMVFEPLDISEGSKPQPPRRTRTKTREAKKWDVLLERVQAGHASIVDVCLDERCSTTALTPWFAALEALDGPQPAPVRVVTLGTSLIASDHITDVLRRRMQTRYGDAGLGYLFIDRPTRNAGRTVRSGTATEGWLIEKVTDAPPLAHAGLGGVAFTAAADAPQTTSYLASGARRLELFAVAQPGAGVVQVLGDGKVLGELETNGSKGQPLFPSLPIGEGVTELLLRTRRGPVRLDGVVLEREEPGVVVDSLGLPGGSATVLLTENEALFSAQLQARKPALVILMIGGNDAFDLSLNRYSVSTARERMQALITRVKTAVPGAACLLASPPDAGVWRMDQTLTPRTQTRLVAGYMSELAKENGCAWYDMQAAMGGEGAIERWWTAGLMNRDLVHPLGLGGDLMGYQLDEALETSRFEHDARTREIGSLHGGRRPGVKRPRSALPPPSGEGRGEGVPGRPRSPRERHGRNTSREVDRPQAQNVDAGALDEAPQCEADGGVAVATDAGVPAPHYLLHAEALSRFFARLRTLETEGTGRVAITQLGASHTEAQAFTDEGRARLAARFGSAGRGFVGAGKPSPKLQRSGVWRTLFGHWNITDALKLRTSSLIWGLTGVRAEAAPGASMTMSFEEPLGSDADTARMQVYYLEEPGGTPPEVIIDGELVPVPPQAVEQPTVRVVEFAAPGHKHVISLSNPGPKPLSFFGIAHELMKPGIVYDALGLPGATAITLASYEQSSLMQQVGARQPDLLVFFYGTNESGLPTKSVDEMKASYPLLFATMRQAAPGADCLILAPTDRMRWKRDGKGWREAESIDEVTAAMEEVALEQGCAFWRTREVMGGKGSIEKWRKQKLANPDHVHLNTPGYQRLAGSFIEELLRAYDGWSPPP